MAEQSEIRYLTAPSIDTKKMSFQEERYQVYRLQRSRVPEEVPERAG